MNFTPTVLGNHRTFKFNQSELPRAIQKFLAPPSSIYLKPKRKKLASQLNLRAWTSPLRGQSKGELITGLQENVEARPFRARKFYYRFLSLTPRSAPPARKPQVAGLISRSAVQAGKIKTLGRRGNFSLTLGARKRADTVRSGGVLRIIISDGRMEEVGHDENGTLKVCCKKY